MRNMRYWLVPLVCVSFGVGVAGLLFTYRLQSETEGGQSLRVRQVPIMKTDAEWKAILTSEQYRVTRKKGTERAFTGQYWNCHDDGIFACVCCGQPLFDSKTKYESGTGWPSFWQPIAEEHVAEEEDNGWFMRRTEVLCSKCDAHLGHVFTDGPQPTGLRYCINSASLKLVKREE
jgi:peptide-methionine (R)-S-oxide reductase